MADVSKINGYTLKDAVAREAISNLEQQEGPVGPAGPKGDTGEVGPAGPAGTFDPNAEFAELNTDAKTIIGAINELLAKFNELNQ